MAGILPWLCCCCELRHSRIQPANYEPPPLLGERTDDDFILSLPPVYRDRYNRRLGLDVYTNATFYPVLVDGYGLIHQPTIVGDLICGSQPMSLSFQSAVFSAGSNLVIKYTHKCGYQDRIHPLVMNAWFGTKAAESGIGPNIHTVSPPRGLTETDIIRFGFVMDPEDVQECVGTSLRYMVMSRAPGTSIQDRDQFELREAFEIGIELFQSLRVMRLHSLIHGDITESNVIVDTGGTVQLIDFGTSFPRNYPDMSPWEIQRNTHWFRDDTFRVIRIMASMVNGVSVYKRFENEIFHRLGKDGLLEWKLEKNFFFIPGQTRDPVLDSNAGGDMNLSRQISRAFVFLVSVVNRMDQDPSDIPYEEILSVLRGTLARLDTQENVDIRSSSMVD